MTDLQKAAYFEGYRTGLEAAAKWIEGQAKAEEERFRGAAIGDGPAIMTEAIRWRNVAQRIRALAEKEPTDNPSCTDTPTSS